MCDIIVMCDNIVMEKNEHSIVMYDIIVMCDNIDMCVIIVMCKNNKMSDNIVSDNK